MSEGGNFESRANGGIGAPYPGGNSAGKVFCIGINKTGTTSLEAALATLGYRMGSQQEGEQLLPHWLKRDFAPIVEFARTAEAFQDIPFSLPYTYLHLDAHFPEAKFILSIRDSAEQWYESVVHFTRSLFLSGLLPTAEEMKRFTYCYPGFFHDAQCKVVPGIGADPFDRDANMAFYEAHNYQVASYFRYSGRLLVINLAATGSYRAMCDFLGRAPAAGGFPHLNASRPVVTQVLFEELEARLAELKRISACIAGRPFGSGRERKAEDGSDRRTAARR